MGFEKFGDSGRGRGRPSGTDPMISLRKSGSIGANTTAMAEYFADEDGAVMYGIEPVADNDADVAAYTVSKSNSGATFAPRAFLEDFELIPDVTTQYTPRWDEEREFIVIDLDDPSDTHAGET